MDIAITRAERRAVCGVIIDYNDISWKYLHFINASVVPRWGPQSAVLSVGDIPKAQDSRGG
jgi:hypothetical protein